MSKRKATGTVIYGCRVGTEINSKLGPDIKAKIGQQLRAMYSDVVNEGVPDRFSEILRRLDNQAPRKRVRTKKTKIRGSDVPSPKNCP